MTDKKVNYTPELVAKIVSDYDGGNGLTVKDIAAKYDRAPKSILGKLVHAKVYVPQDKPVKTFKEDGPSKKELLFQLYTLGFSEVAIAGLANATKPALQEVAERAATATSEVENEEPAAQAA